MCESSATNKGGLSFRWKLKYQSSSKKIPKSIKIWKLPLQASPDGKWRVVHLTPYDKEDATDPRKYTAAVTNEFPIIVAEGTRNEVRVTDIEFLTNQTFIYFEVYGESPELLNGRISLETSSGEEIRPYIYFKAKDKSMSHKLEFPPLDEKQDYILSTTERQKLIVLDELKIKVPIPK